MKELYEKKYSKGNKYISIINYREDWAENEQIYPLRFFTNKAKKGKDSCLDVHLQILGISFNYTNYKYKGSGYGE